MTACVYCPSGPPEWCRCNCPQGMGQALQNCSFLGQGLKWLPVLEVREAGEGVSGTRWGPGLENDHAAKGRVGGGGGCSWEDPSSRSWRLGTDYQRSSGQELQVILAP